MDKKLMSIGISMLVLKLLDEKEMYGYQVIKELEARSERVFELKEGTLYPILHLLEEKLAVTSYEKQTKAGRTRKYYQITKQGKRLLEEKTKEWELYQQAVSNVLRGVTTFA